MLARALLFLCSIAVSVCLKQCIDYCSKNEHAFDATVIESVQDSAAFCVIKCQDMDECGGFNYDSATSTCYLINNADNLTPAVGLTAWSVKLCSKFRFLNSGNLKGVTEEYFKISSERSH